MDRKKTDKLLLIISIAGYLTLSVSFVLMPLEAAKVLGGALFWLGLLLGLIPQVILEKRRRSLFDAYQVQPKQMQRPRGGLLTFFANGPAKAADIILAVSAAGLVLSCWLTRGTGYICYIMLTLTVFFLSMHCVLNGRIYFYIINQEKIIRALEKKKDRTFRKEREIDV